MILKYIKKKEDNYETVGQVLKQEFFISSNLLTDLRKNKLVFVNGSSTYLDFKLQESDVVTVDFDLIDEDCSNIVPVKMNLDILYEDEYLLIINKPAGIPVHPSMLHFEDSLSNGVKYYFDSINLKKKIRPVNRLDRNTSGIVIFAKNAYIHSRLSYLMEKNQFKKEYIAICEGMFVDNSGTINAPIARKDNSIIERCVRSDGDVAITHYSVIENYCINNHNMSLVKILLETGRTHQIRVHMAYMGHPILGDSLYGNASNLINRQALHSCSIEFQHPITGKELTITADLPEDMKMLIK
mgnify:FL=1